MSPPFRGSPWVFAVLVFFYSVGMVGHLIPALLPWMLLLTPGFLWVSGGLVAFLSIRKSVGPTLLWLAPFLMVTFGLEAVGVATGQVFGTYHYTTTLGTLVLGVPPVIGWNWVLVVLGVHTAARRLLTGIPEIIRVVVVGLTCVAFDLLLEPVAIGLGYWVWESGSVPWRNYAAWGLISMAGSWWAGRIPKLSTEPILGWYVVLQAVFFAVLGAAGVRA